MTINERLFEILDSKGLKDIDLARKIGKNKSVISTWRTRGTNPPVEYIVPICELLNISLEELLTGNNNCIDLSEEEKELIQAYRAADPGMKAGARKLLDAPELPGKSLTLEPGNEAI